MFPTKKIILFVILSVIVGSVVGWIDSSPNWDDTGITVFMVVTSTIVLGTGFSRYFWLWGFIVGVIIFGCNVILHNNFQSLIVILIALFGSGIGSIVGKIFLPARQNTLP